MPEHYGALKSVGVRDDTAHVVLAGWRSHAGRIPEGWEWPASTPSAPVTVYGLASVQSREVTPWIRSSLPWWRWS